MSVVLLILGDKLVEVRQAHIVINDVVKEEADDMITIPAVVIMIGDQDLKISIGVDKYNLSRIKDLRQNPLQAKRSCHLGEAWNPNPASSQPAIFARSEATKRLFLNRFL